MAVESKSALSQLFLGVVKDLRSAEGRTGLDWSKCWQREGRTALNAPFIRFQLKVFTSLGSTRLDINLANNFYF